MAATLARAATEAEAVAIKGLEAMNRNHGTEFIRVAHPKLIQKFRNMMVGRCVKAAQEGVAAKELKDWYGVTTIEELRTLAPEFVARVTVDHMSESEPAGLREMMHTAKFAVVGSRPIDPATVAVQISVDVGDGHPPKSVEVISKIDGQEWKYWGFPELARE